MAVTTEIAPDVFRISVFAPCGNIQFDHFLGKDDEPLLYHTGLRGMRAEIREAVAKLIDLSQLRHISVVASLHTSSRSRSEVRADRNDETAEAMAIPGAVTDRTGLQLGWWPFSQVQFGLGIDRPASAHGKYGGRELISFHLGGNGRRPNCRRDEPSLLALLPMAYRKREFRGSQIVRSGESSFLPRTNS